MGLEFPTNLLISRKSLPKIFLAETKETVSESVCSSETISFPFFEIVQAALLEVPLVLTFKSKTFFQQLQEFERSFKHNFFSLTG